MKKVIKKVVAKAPVKKTVAKKPMMKTGGSKKSLPKAQPGQSVGTPFQGYMKNTGAVASDTLMKTTDPENVQLNGQPGFWYVQKKPVAKNPNNQCVLEQAFEKTYGQGWKSESGQPGKGETFEQYKRRMGPLQKKGGTTKSTYKKGGAVKVTTKKVMVKSKKK